MSTSWEDFFFLRRNQAVERLEQLIQAFNCVDSHVFNKNIIGALLLNKVGLCDCDELRRTTFLTFIFVKSKGRNIYSEQEFPKEFYLYTFLLITLSKLLKISALPFPVLTPFIRFFFLINAFFYESLTGKLTLEHPNIDTAVRRLLDWWITWETTLASFLHRLRWRFSRKFYIIARDWFILSGIEYVLGDRKLFACIIPFTLFTKGWIFKDDRYSPKWKNSSARPFLSPDGTSGHKNNHFASSKNEPSNGWLIRTQPEYNELFINSNTELLA